MFLVELISCASTTNYFCNMNKVLPLETMKIYAYKSYQSYLLCLTTIQSFILYITPTTQYIWNVCNFYVSSHWLHVNDPMFLSFLVKLKLIMIQVVVLSSHDYQQVNNQDSCKLAGWLGAMFEFLLQQLFTLSVYDWGFCYNHVIIRDWCKALDLWYGQLLRDSGPCGSALLVTQTMVCCCP